VGLSARVPELGGSEPVPPASSTGAFLADDDPQASSTAVDDRSLLGERWPMDETPGWVNEVRLVGRVSAAAEERELPSGDQVAQLRVVVPRSSTAGGGARVDTIDVACWSPRTRRSARSLHPDDHVEVVGALRRRFFRAGTATVSRYEIEAGAIKRIRTKAGG
jgi:single-strand DNA-binding protein